MDLSQPRNVEESVGRLSEVVLHNIDNLYGVAEANLKMRLKEVERAEAIINNELKFSKIMLKREQAEPIIRTLCNKAETIRCKEYQKALKMLGELDDEQRKVIEDLTQIITERILYNPVINLRKAAEHSDINIMVAAKKLFKLD